MPILAYPTPTVTSLCDQADQRLFSTITQNNVHPLQQLLPPEIEKHYSIRARQHNYQLPRKITCLAECIGVAMIVSGVHFLPKKLTFFSRRPQKTV